MVISGSGNVPNTANEDTGNPKVLTAAMFQKVCLPVQSGCSMRESGWVCVTNAPNVFFLSLSLASASILSPLPFSSLLFLSLCLHLERTSTSSCRLQVLCLPQPNRDNPSAKKRVTKFMYMQMPLLCLVSSKSTESQTGQLQNSCLAPSCHVIRWSGRMCSPQRGTVRGSHDIPTVTQSTAPYEWPKDSILRLFTR